MVEVHFPHGILEKYKETSCLYIGIPDRQLMQAENALSLSTYA